MRRWVFVLLVACSDPPASDLDGDGIADADDECIAGFSDERIDADGDGRDATLDLCPHDANAAAGDLDEDGIPDACDPFPADVVDTRRCVTGFRVPWMNASYLDARAGEQAWRLRAEAGRDDTPPPALVATADQSVSIVSLFPIEHPSVTYDVVGTATLPIGASFKLWLRAAPDAPSSRDLACLVETNGAGVQQLSVWSANARHATVDLPAAITSAFRVRGTIQDITSSTVLCRVTAGGASIATRLDAAPISGGLYGFAATNADVTIDSLTIDSTDVVQRF